ncbi:unnamed protein product, partial [Effrenium voratum]
VSDEEKVDNDEELPERADEAADGPEDGNQEKRYTKEPLAREFMVRLLRANFELDNQEEYQARRLALRNSGPLSHYRASAAALYLMADCHNEFKHCSMAWAGVLLSRGSVFFHRKEREHFLSLGFKQWCCIGARLTCVKVGNK